MKRPRIIRTRGANCSIAGFKLVEMMFAMGIFTLVMGSVLTLYVFSARATSAVSSQLQFNSQSRVVNFMVKEIKAANSVAVQTYTNSAFSSIPVGSAQQGNALALSVPSGTNTIQVWYWRDPVGQLWRASSSTNSSKLWFTNITNANLFAITDYNGVILSTNMQRTLVDIKIFALDSNVKDFRQTFNFRAAAEQRNN